MNRKSNAGIIFFFVHLCVEIVSFAVLTHHYSAVTAGLASLVFDMAAFVPQAFFGEFIDKHRRFPSGISGVLMMTAGVCISCIPVNGMKITGVIIMALGNAVLHEQGALETVAKGEGKIFPAALFVSGGSFGVVTGKTMAGFGLSLLWLAVPLAALAFLLCISGGLKEDTVYPEFNCVHSDASASGSVRADAGLIIAAAFVITTVRSFLAYAIPIAWKKELWQDFLLFFVMGAGKAAGGYFADRFGARKTGVVSTLLAVPFLIAGDNNMVVSVTGVFLFSMTMCITFEMILSVLPKNPGLSFGITTFALFCGVVPVFLVHPGKLNNIILIVILSVLCSFLLGFFCCDRKYSGNRLCTEPDCYEGGRNEVIVNDK